MVEDVDVKSDLATVRISARDLPRMKLGTSKDTARGVGDSPGLPLACPTPPQVSNTARPRTSWGMGKDIVESTWTDANHGIPGAADQPGRRGDWNQQHEG